MTKRYVDVTKKVLNEEDAGQMISGILASMRKRECKFPHYGTYQFDTEPHDKWYRLRVRELFYKFEEKWNSKAVEYLQSVYHTYGDLPL